MNYEDNPASIKYYVKEYLLQNKADIKDKIIVDIPAGNGITSKIIAGCGGIPMAFDLFPEYFRIDGIKCQQADVRNGIPLSDKSADYLICQEGIEHFADQLSAIKEFNRILKKNGILLITTPNYSNLRSKISYLLSESERFNSTMPPNEFDSIWMSDQNLNKEIYLGHIFLIGIQKLRVLASISGFKIKKIHPTKIKTTSLFFLFLFYPFIFISNYYTYIKNCRKHPNNKSRQKIYHEVFRLSINIRLLIDSHLMIEFEKISDYQDVYAKLKSQFTEFGTT